VGNASSEQNASGNETHAGFTPTHDNAMICLVVGNYDNDNAVSSQSCTNPGTLTERFDHVDNGACAFAAAPQTGGPSATGNITWSQSNNATLSVVFAIFGPETGPAMPVFEHHYGLLRKKRGLN
jgi:hypothetical protein